MVPMIIYFSTISHSALLALDSHVLIKHKASPVLDSSMLLAIIVIKCLSNWLEKDLILKKN